MRLLLKSSRVRKIILLLLAIFLPFAAVSQISGKVFSAKDSVALQGVSLYFDGTSIGAVTNSQGEFRLQETAATSPLVISFLGYENLIIDTSQKGGNLGSFYLQEKTETLAEVVVEPDTWSREKKLKHFLREFLGKTPEALKCRIKNPEVLELQYRPSMEVLTATAREPLVIINRHLGYEITYNLTSFTIEFSTGTSGLTFPLMVSYEGTSFFKELTKKPRKKHLRNRKESFYGSSLHFMRSLAARQLEENKFEIYFERFKAAPYQHFQIEKRDRLTRVDLTAEKVSILYSGIEQSGLQTRDAFFIDELGNHTPPLAVLFSGEMSLQRIAHLLPLDYRP